MSNSNEFSLVLGGPLYLILRKSHLVGDHLQWVRRRIIAAVVLAWVPLLLLATAQGKLLHGAHLPFLYDVEVHVRLLLAIPLLLLAEIEVNDRLRTVVSQFVERNLLPESGRAIFDVALSSAVRLRDSRLAELILLAVVYAVGVGVIWRTQTVLSADGWYGAVADGTWRPSWAGWWLACVSLPLFQFLLLRWYYRLFIWARFLWQVSRMKLRLVPTHPDHLGGLGFLAGVGYAFSLLLVAQGVVMAGIIADRIFFTGAKLVDFKLDLFTLVAVLLCAILGPLLVFSRQLAHVRRVGLREYGTLAQQYVQDYDHKWLRGGAPAGEPLLGSADLQSLADLGNSFEVVQQMKWAPFTLRTVMQLSVTTLLPALPLTLTMLSLTELLEHLLKIVF